MSRIISDDYLRQSFLSIQDDFLAAVIDGPAATSDFSLRFQELHQLTLNHASPSSSNNNALHVAHKAALGISTLARSLVDLEAEAEGLSTEMDSELADIFSTISFEAAKGTDKGYSQRDLEEGRQSSLHDDELKERRLLPARHWLIEHIHNPYPSSKVKQMLAKRSETSVKSIDEWFSSARRKIGWTAASKRYFKGNRSLTIDCAERIFIEGTGRSFYSEQVVRDFEVMEDTAKRLFSSKALQSDLVNKLDKFPSSTTPSTVNRKQKRRRIGSSTVDEEATASSTSSTSSGSGSSRKRSRYSTEERDTESDSSRPLKRGRSISSLSSSSFSSTPSFRSSSTESESTASSSSGPLTPHASPTTSPTITYSELPTHILDNWIDVVSAESALLSPNMAEQLPSVLSQKRSLSDEDSHRSAKRARHWQEQPQPQPEPPSPDQSHTAPPAPQQAASPECASKPQLPEILPSGEEGDALDPGAPVDTSQDDYLNEILSQFNADIPPVWGDDSLGDSLFEASLFDFSSFGAESGFGLGPGNLNASPAAAPLSIYDFMNLPQPANGDAYPGDELSVLCAVPPTEGSSKSVDAPTRHTATDPISLSSADLAFLDGLGDARGAQTPRMGSPQSFAGSRAGPESPFVLVDAPGYASPPAEKGDTVLEDSERAKKLERLNEILAEAERLKQEVYG